MIELKDLRPRKDSSRKPKKILSSEVGVAWLKGEVGMSQIMKAVSASGGAYVHICTALRRAYQEGLLKEVEK